MILKKALSIQFRGMKNEIMAFFSPAEESSEVVPNEAGTHKEDHHEESTDNVVCTL